MAPTLPALRPGHHAACGMSHLAPGCDDAACLIRRLDDAAAKGWDTTALSAALDARITADLAEILYPEGTPV